ncbi:PilZ domain-containing protein [Pseudoflavonifractor sp. 524-17]|uniref:PilZ domain-containing protein n=1 Tax=Pseudoflavonifractor sp. 524-17 TaxID=2304577 RepID=UPI00137B592A|nr:PilZ domain-containing protein [Pseudoflavonifractor sp. 524-17]NCE66132.1 PilZ domain-containing protein [Pseudoflavonifractor sp. 524-17]
MEQGSQIGQLELRPGMRVEVLTIDNKLTFLGKVDNYRRGMLQIRGAKDEILPPALYNREVKLQFFQGSSIFVFQGAICGGNDDFWRVHELQIMSVEERREYFRQYINVPAKVERENHSGQTQCTILDISAGGLLLKSKDSYEVGELLCITRARIVREEEDFSFTCRVRRVVEEGSKRVYGCQFEALPSREQNRLLRAILIAQRKDRQRGQKREDG